MQEPVWDRMASNAEVITGNAQAHAGFRYARAVSLGPINYYQESLRKTQYEKADSNRD